MVLQLFYRYRLFSFGVTMISMSAFEVLGPIMVGPLPRTQQEPCALLWLHARLHQSSWSALSFGSTTPSLIPTLVTAPITL